MSAPRLDTLGRRIVRWAPPVERFTQRISEVPAPDGFDLPCWQWDAPRVDGYGHFKVNGRIVLVHRWAYEHHVGPVPDGLVLDHLCRNRACANPDHLEPVTDAVNIRRGVDSRDRRALITHCKEGHEFTPENTYAWRRHRICRACQAVRARRYRAEKRAGVAA